MRATAASNVRSASNRTRVDDTALPETVMPACTRVTRVGTPTAKTGPNASMVTLSQRSIWSASSRVGASTKNFGPEA